MPALKLDENVPDSVGAILRQAGHDVALARDQQLAGVSNHQGLSVASREDRVLISFDRGFTNVIQHPPGSTAGIVVMRLREQTLPRMRQVAAVLGSLLATEHIRGRLWVLDESRLRIWPRDPG